MILVYTGNCYRQSTKLKSKETFWQTVKRKRSSLTVHQNSIDIHIFLDYIVSFMESSIRNLKFQDVATFEEANKLGRYPRMNKHMTQRTAEKLRKDILHINNIHISNQKTNYYPYEGTADGKISDTPISF